MSRRDVELHCGLALFRHRPVRASNHSPLTMTEIADHRRQIPNSITQKPTYMPSGTTSSHTSSSNRGKSLTNSFKSTLITRLRSAVGVGIDHRPRLPNLSPAF